MTLEAIGWLCCRLRPVVALSSIWVGWAAFPGHNAPRILQTYEQSRLCRPELCPRYPVYIPPTRSPPKTQVKPRSRYSWPLRDLTPARPKFTTHGTMPAEPTFQYRYSSGTGFSSSTCSPSSLKHYAPPSAVTLTFHFLRSAGSGAHRGDPGSGTGNGWENRGKTISPRMPGEPLLFC